MGAWPRRWGVARVHRRSSWTKGYHGRGARRTSRPGPDRSRTARPSTPGGTTTRTTSGWTRARSTRREKYLLQVELLKLQYWAKDTGQRVVIVFEGRDAAGKGGTIKRFMEHLNPRGARVVALEKPTEAGAGASGTSSATSSTCPTRGEIVMFDRSWYNRAGVERVMGFCSDEEYESSCARRRSSSGCSSDSGIHLTKFWFSVTQRGAAHPLRDPAEATRSAVEALPHRPGVARQVGRLHRGQGGDVRSAPTPTRRRGPSSSPTTRSALRGSTRCADLPVPSESFDYEGRWSDDPAPVAPQPRPRTTPAAEPEPTSDPHVAAPRPQHPA
jgi:hypothetical protein